MSGRTPLRGDKVALRSMQDGAPGLRVPAGWWRSHAVKRQDNGRWAVVLVGLTAEQAAEVQHQLLNNGRSA